MKTARDVLLGVMREISSVYVGKEDLVRLAVAALFMEGHLLIEGVPGTGKTLLAKALAKAIGGTYRRIQGHPDVLPTDITGFHVYRLDGSRQFVPGPIMSNIVLFDELNRTPTRSQSALLEAMQEYQVTVDGVTYALPRPFMVIATEVPPQIARGVYAITETLIDRFAVRAPSGYNPPEEEALIVERSDAIVDVPVTQVTTPEDVQRISRSIGYMVHVDENIVRYIVALVTYIRGHEAVAYGPSHRATVHLMRLSRVYALLDGRDYVIPDDVKEVAVNVIAHRVFLKEEYEAEGRTPEDIVREALETVPTPK